MQQWILHTMDLINELYEDIPLRQRRMEQFTRYEEKLDALCEKGAMLKMKNNVSTVFLARVGFINNKKKPKEVSLFFAPVFPVPEKEATADPKPRTTPIPFLRLVCNTISFTERGMIIKDSKGCTCATLTKLEGSAAEKFGEWKQKFNAYEKKTHHIFWLHSEIAFFYDRERRAFHQ